MEREKWKYEKYILKREKEDILAQDFQDLSK